MVTQNNSADWQSMGTSEMGTSEKPSNWMDSAQPQKFQHDVTTNVMPIQRDHLGQCYWESSTSPAGYEVRAEARIPPHLPGVIIFVHGVNSEGEWYDFAEGALCQGLNVRLNRNDLQPNTYTVQDAGRTAPRRLDKEKSGHSPVIRFYWGYRAPDGKEHSWRVPLRNIEGIDGWSPASSKVQGPWYWGGGPFQNGTNNLPQLWSASGCRRHVAGFDLQNMNTELDRQLQDAPPRTYFSHAAERLADLIDSIRKECPRDTVTVMSHS
jgi:hypothetical protein